jgi:catechol 2,3-dioxygenase-like lactoylglutathione lyase family enzyme
MLGSSRVMAVIAVRDQDVAKEFYGGTLGLEISDGDDPGGILYSCGGGSHVFVYQSSYAGTNQATVAAWQVTDIDQEIAALKAKGISFEHYDIPNAAVEGDVHVLGNIKSAWFKDPDGNILNIIDRSSGA